MKNATYHANSFKLKIILWVQTILDTAFVQDHTLPIHSLFSSLSKTCIRKAIAAAALLLRSSNCHDEISGLMIHILISLPSVV